MIVLIKYQVYPLYHIFYNKIYDIMGIPGILAFVQKISLRAKYPQKIRYSRYCG